MGDELRTPLEELGRKIAAAEDAQLGAIVERARSRFEAHGASSPGTPVARVPRQRFAARSVWVLAAAALVLVLLLVRSRRPASLAVETASPRAVASMSLLASSTDTSLRFSDGATVVLGADGQARVVALTAEGARVAVARGRAAVAVPLRAGARWSFDVGPFALVVSGARFDTSWDPSTHVFELEPHEGNILVSGPTVSGERVVPAGQKLRIALAIGEEALHDPPAPAAPPAPPPLAAAPGQRSSAGGTAPRAAQPTPAWRTLSADGRYAEAMTAVSSTFDALCSSEPSGEVIALGDTARLAGDTVRAARAYEAARSRFAGSSDAALAAFALGRMAAQQGNDADAARWFSSYLREAPGDRLAREALGRLMEARDRNGESAAARALAGEYLAKHPDGPHAKLARKIQGE